MPNRTPFDVTRAQAALRSSRAAERAVWADEIAIDFPSVPALVARVRDAFVDEDGSPAPFCADVLLTPAQAREGHELPVVVTRRHACPACLGRGEAWLEPCTRCDGRGEQTTRTEVVVTIPPCVADGDCCRVAIAVAGVAPADLSIRVLVRQPEGSDAVR